MKISLAYPKIPDTTGFLPSNCVAFEKYDGTNIHFDWNRTFKSFGTRRDKFDFSDEGWEQFHAAHPGLDDLRECFNQMSIDLNRRLYQLNYDGNDVVVFTEYLGPSSFAGEHKPHEKHKLVIIDLQVNGVILEPEIVSNKFYFLETAKVLYRGKYSGQLVEDIRKGVYTQGEGAVLKGLHKGQVHMAKIKTDKYMRSLQYKFKENWKDYWE